MKNIKTIDLHAAGEPCRVIYDAFYDLEGNTMNEKLENMKANYENYRSALMMEPRGHHDMFGSILTRPVHDDADAGVIYLSNAGFLTMCIHGTICTARALVELGWKLKNPDRVVFDAPCGRIIAFLKRDEKGKLIAITVQNVLSFVYTPQPVHFDVDGLGKIEAHIVFAGNFFILVNTDINPKLKIKLSHYHYLAEEGTAIMKRANELFSVQHPENPDLKGISLTVFYQHSGDNPVHFQDTVVFGEQQVDRSPCGSGTSAAMTLQHYLNHLDLDEEFVSESIIGSKFDGYLEKSEKKVGDFDAFTPFVTGMSYVTGRNEWCFDPEDPFVNGFDVF